MPPCGVIVVEPWLAGSHRSWAEGLVTHAGRPERPVRLVGHEGRVWRWRMRGGSLTLAEAVARVVAEHGQPEALVVSSHVHLPALLGALRRVVDPSVPVAFYLHESQLLFPVGPSQQPSEEFATVQWLGMAAADEVWCNSAFHRDVLLAALDPFLRGSPDESHHHRLASVAARTHVLPVGIEGARLRRVPSPQPSAGEGDLPPLVLWNHRWDHDKNPEQFIGVLRALAQHGVPFRVAVVGENRRVDPRELVEAQRDLGDRIDTWGWVDREAYEMLLRRSDVVVSTARHEFFGVAVVEAMAAGAVPLLPRRLSYPELVPAELHDAVLYRGQLFDRLRSILGDLPGARARVAGLADTMTSRFDWSVVGPQYGSAVDRLVAVASHRSAPGQATS